ncbi:MAG: hypothetical protein CMJ18_23325 [Phycisphaeraceae bacterium]|nr:hypothetical protein [Phycisphaeraceae bacterium]
MSRRIGIDTGGTFTDIVALDEQRDGLVFFKVHSTPDDPGRALVQGVRGAVERWGDGGAGLRLLVHGTTVATNTVLQRAGAKAALLTTAGFRDVLHIQRQSRPRLYDMRGRRAEPLVPRARRFEVEERILHDGSVDTPLSTSSLEPLAEALRRDGVEAVAVAFLHSHVNPKHEIEAGQWLEAELPGVTVCLSHELVRSQGEYERFSTCAMNAYVQPVMQRYLGRLDRALKDESVEAPLVVMKSNGGVMTAGQVARHCVQTILSGPAGGVVAAAAIAAHHHNRNLITADMGGTSFDVAVIEDGAVGFARDAEVSGLALNVPMLDLHTVGAGGGSIGWVDAGGSLRVGPHSAGSNPGPACYGLGGTKPTVTDANLVLGRVAAQSRLAGGMQLDIEAARRCIHDTLAAPLDMTAERAAEGMVRVVNTTMVAAIRRITVERGHDPRVFSLCAFGGAGPLHGAELAAEMGMGETIIPAAPGVTSALGLLMSNLSEDRVRSLVRLLDDVDPSQLTAMFEQMSAEARRDLVLGDASEPTYTTVRRIAMRYHGQGHDLAIDVAPGAIETGVIAESFHAAHERMYGYRRPEEPVESVSLWVSEQIDLQPARMTEARPGTGDDDRAAPRRRTAWFGGERHDTPVFDRADLAPEDRLDGPAIVEQDDATTVVLPGQAARVDRYGQIILSGAGGRDLGGDA